jgi:hypothetical protein
MAARLGITPQEMYDRYNLKVAAKAVGQGGVLNADQTTTPEFRTWFGESKVTDEQGAPLVVYHGTNQNITAFDSSKIGARDAGFFGSGFYFTPDQDAALDYADSAVADTGQGEAVALSTYVSLQNPFVWDMSDEGAAQTREALATFGIKRESVRGNSAALSNSKEREQFNRAVRAAGYDGVVVRDEDGVQEVVAFEPTQIKSATDNQGTFSAESANILEQSVSTRLPTAKKALENPLEEMLVIGLDAAKADPKAFEKNVELIRQYLNFRDNKSANTPDKAAEQFIRHNVDNLLWLYDQVPAETRERSKLWYDGARAIVDRWVPKYNVSDAQASGMLAVLSPQKDWFQNVSLAERVLDIMATQQDFTWSDEMSQTAAGLAALNPEDVGEITGKTLGEIDSDYLQAIWVRVYDQTYNERGYRVVSPEGDFTDWVYNADGTTKSKTAWGSFNEIGKAISIYKDGSIANISAALGEQHKVRNFYNNIFNPASQHGDVTIDTHAVAAGLLRPLSGSATEVLHNFGAGGAASSSVFGSKGTYGIYAEAYRRAAEQRGVLPREMQSITWEAVHGLYTAGFKAQASNVAKIDAIWENYKKRRISLDDARKQLLDAAGRINPPEWERPGDGPSAPAWASSYTGELRQDGGPAGTAGRGDGGLPFDAAAGVLNQDGPLLAPNGQPSNLTPELHRLVRTPEFKAWFGDWEAFAGMQGGVWNDTTNSVSKAVDENGEPLVVYHGTDKGGFNTFNTPGGTERGDLGIFLTPNRAMAASYVKRGRGGDFSRDEVLTFNNAGVAASGVYPLFVNIRNPYETDFEGALWTGERLGQYSAIDANGETIYAEDGRAYFDNYEDAQALISGKKGASVEGAADHWETTDSAVREARSNDNDGTVIRNVVDDGGGNSTYMGEPSDVFVAFDPTQIKSVENFGAFNPNDPDIYQQGPRGTFSPEQLLVTLNENADLSTFLHESGHFYLEVLADLASQPNAPQQIKDDMAQVLKWFGVPDLATWNGYTLDQKRQYHERWAESFEQYLFEGKAPNQELQPLFRRFRSWLVNVYKSLTQFMRGRNLKLNDEVRQVFDRLVATDEQIAQAEEAAGMLPDFEATNEAIEQLQARSLRDLKWTVKARGKTLKALEKEAATLRKELEAEVRAEVEQQPLYKAINWLKKGETTDPETGDLIKAEKGYRLSTAALAEMYPDTMLGRPDLKGLRGMTGKEGLHPDMAADMFGFESGDVLVRSILDAEPIASVIEGMTDQRMLERHGDLATPEAREAAANEAVHNEARARSLATELKSQADMMNQRQDTGRTDVRGRPITVNAVVEAAKQFALNLAARRRLKDLKNAAWQHRSAEARAGKRWQQLTAEGKSEEAVQAKRDQLLNNYAAKALQDAQVEVRKTLEFFKRVVKGSDEKVVERGRDPDVVNAMRAILAAYDVAPRLEKSALAYMETVSKNDPAMYAALKPSVDGALLNAKPLTELTLEELRGLNDELRAMWVLAKRSRQMEVDGNLMDIEEAADELVTRMDVIGIPDTIPGEKGAITNKEEAGIKLRFALSILTRVEQWAERLDGRFGGPFLRLVFQPVKDAADRFRTDRVSYRQRYTELLKNVAPMLPPGPIDAPELGYTFGNARDSGAAELLHAILHTGNESNKRKLLLGRGWATQNADGTLDTGRWDAFIERMQGEGKINKAHYDFAQGVWDLLEDMKPLAQETHRKVFGRYFAEVTANEVVTPFGTYRGGYVPAQTDSRLVKDAKLRELAEGENESMAYAFPASPSGFTKARVEYNQPLMLDLRTLAQHMDKVLLFSHMQGAVTDVRRLLTNKRVSYALDRIDPGAYEGMLIPWLNRAARQVVETPVVGDRKLSRFLAASRSRAGMALMFANLSNTFQQITGFSLAAVKVKPALMMKATAEFIADPKAMKTTVAEASPFMKDRMLNEVSAMNDAVEDILVNPTLLEKGQAWTQRHAYFMQAAVDNTMSPIIWTAGYNQAIAEGQSERDAVRFADSVIRQTQGTTLPEDISRFESGPAYGRIFTQFVSYFNMMANTNATAVSQITGEMGLKKGAGKLVYVALAGLLVPIWVAEAIAHAFRGGPEDEDDDGWIDDWLMAVFGLGTLRGLVAQVPIVGQAAQLVVNRFNDNPADDKFSLSPAVSLIESTVSAPASVYKAIVDDGNKQKAVRDVVAAATMITGLPLFAVGRPLGYLAGLADQRIEPTGPADLARGLVTGTASPESKQR